MRPKHSWSLGGLCSVSLWLLVIPLAVSQCAAARPSPQDTVSAYAQALRDGRYVDAYNMLSGTTRQTLSYREFERNIQQNPDAIQESIRWFESIDHNATPTARIDLRATSRNSTAGASSYAIDSVTLVQENGSWRLNPSALEFYAQNTPRQALRSFIMAFEQQRFDVLLRFAPRRIAEGMTIETLRTAWTSPTAQQGRTSNSTVELLRLGVSANPIDVVGNRATMRYGTDGRFTVVLIREDGVWKIESFE